MCTLKRAISCQRPSKEGLIQLRMAKKGLQKQFFPLEMFNDFQETSAAVGNGSYDRNGYVFMLFFQELVH